MMLTNKANNSGRRLGASVVAAAALCASLTLGVAPASAASTALDGGIAATTDGGVEPYMGKSGLDSFTASCLELKDMIESAEGGGFWGDVVRVALMPEWLAKKIQEWKDAYYEAHCDDFFGPV